ncbi:MAG: hypothetical protein QXS20_09965 [Candidatus Thorarchaeota archaeon]
MDELSMDLVGVSHVEGREVDPVMDPEVVRLTALNLELAVKNLIASKCAPECVLVTADIWTHRLVAIPTRDGTVKVLVFEA